MFFVPLQDLPLQYFELLHDEKIRQKTKRTAKITISALSQRESSGLKNLFLPFIKRVIKLIFGLSWIVYKIPSSANE